MTSRRDEKRRRQKRFGSGCQGKAKFFYFTDDTIHKQINQRAKLPIKKEINCRNKKRHRGEYPIRRKSESVKGVNGGNNTVGSIGKKKEEGP